MNINGTNIKPKDADILKNERLSDKCQPLKQAVTDGFKIALDYFCSTSKLDMDKVLCVKPIEKDILDTNLHKRKFLNKRGVNFL